MTYKNDIEVEFDYDGVGYGANADVIVSLHKSDVGPIGYREHVFAWVADDVEIKNLRVGVLPNGEDLVDIPKDIKEKAEIEITNMAYIRAEEHFE